MNNMKIQGKVYLVGGAVRDIMLGVDPKDRDYVVVGGSQENLLSLGFKQVGADFPVFLHPETNEEYALARIERKSGIGYNGFTVETEGVTLFDDLARRDFTINAMAMDVETEIVYDPYNGLTDLNRGVIRHVSNAFKDDPLRVLRAFRFAARYDYEIAPETLRAIDTVPVEDLKALVPERIFMEVTKSINDGRFHDFYEHLFECSLVWLLKDVLFYMSRYDLPKRSTNVDGFLTALIVNGMKKQKPIADFNAISFHKQVAKIIVDYSTSEKTAESRYTLINRLGDWNSPKFKLFMAAKYVQYENQSVKMTFKALWFVYNSVTSKTVLEVDPTLNGPALGAAIKAARVEAIRKFIEE